MQARRLKVHPNALMLMVIEKERGTERLSAIIRPYSTFPLRLHTVGASKIINVVAPYSEYSYRVADTSSIPHNGYCPGLNSS